MYKDQKPTKISVCDGEDIVMRVGQAKKTRLWLSGWFLYPAFFLTLCFLLSGCAYLPSGQYKPLESPLAASAQPYYPASNKRIYCEVGKGSARFSAGWYAFDKTEFILPDGERVGVALTRRKKSDQRAEIMGYFARADQKLLFCPVVEAPPGERISCASLYALDDDLEMGIKRTLDVPDAIRGGVISCAYDIKNLRRL